MSQNPWDNAGPPIDGWPKDTAPQRDTVVSLAQADMDAFDKLGPLTRAAMSGSCVMFSATSLLVLVRTYCRERWPYNPTVRPDHKHVDRTVAGWIRQADPEIMAKIRVSDADALRLMDDVMTP